MTKCYQTSIHFSPVKRRQVEADFCGGDISSDAGVLLLSQVDRKLGLSRSVAKAIGDEHRQASCEHAIEALVKQRTYALALGCEDLNGHQALRHALALLTAVASDKPLSSSSTLCRFERSAEHANAIAIAIHEALFQQFVQAQDKPPRRLTLDFDATDTPLHDEQEGRFYMPGIGCHS